MVSVNDEVTVVQVMVPFTDNDSDGMQFADIGGCSLKSSTEHLTVESDGMGTLE